MRRISVFFYSLVDVVLRAEALYFGGRGAHQDCHRQLVFDGNCEGITFLDPAETAQKYINILRRHSNMLQTRTASRFRSTKTANTGCSSENSSSTWKNSLRFAVYGLQMICWQAFLTIEVIICKLKTVNCIQYNPTQSKTSVQSSCCNHG